MASLNSSNGSSGAYGAAPARQRVETAPAETRKVFAEGPIGLKQTGYGLAQHCIHVENHTSAPEPANICQSCYDRLQERVDVLEAAMHMDLKEASQLVYDAVWADPSDPSKTYNNAAQALLAELRRRSGVTNVFGPLQPGMN